MGWGKLADRLPDGLMTPEASQVRLIKNGDPHYIFIKFFTVIDLTISLICWIVFLLYLMVQVL